MTEKANPSPNRPADPFKTAGAIAYGGIVDGFIVDASSPTEISTQDIEIDETAFDNFSENSSGSSLTVSIGPGEGFVFGSWLAVDTSTSVTLSASTSSQTVYFGWNKNTANDVIIGLSSDFSNLTSDADKKIPLYDFDTDGSGVTSVTDRRQIGRAQDLSALSVADELGIPVYSNTANAPESEGSVVAIDGSGSQTVGIYSYDGSSYIKAGKTEETVEDIVAGLVTGGSAISVSYDDVNGTLTINNDEPYTDEQARDTIAAALVAGTNIGITHDDPNNEIIVDTSALNPEEVQDEVNSLVTGGSDVNTVYDDANDTLTISLSNNSVTINSGDGLSGGGSVSLGSSITIDHDDTSSESDVFADNNDVIDNIDIDSNGHVTTMTTEYRDLSDWGVPNDLNINSADTFGLPQRSSDPSASAGDIWYRTDLD